MELKIGNRKVFYLLAVMIASTLFAPATASILPAAWGAEAQPRTLFCEETVGSLSENPSSNLTVDLAINELIGDTLSAYAVLLDGNAAPIVAAPVHFYVSDGNSPSIWVGHAITDCDGVAILRFAGSNGGPIEITAKFDGGNGLTPNTVTANLQLKRLAPQEPDILSMGAIGVTSLLGLIVFIAILGGGLAVREDRKQQA